MRKALWIIWLAVVWFFSLVFHSVAFNESGFVGIAILLGVFWLIYLAGLWFEKTHITDTAWAMLLGYAIGCIRLLDLLPNQQELRHWLRFVPTSLLGAIALSFIIIFVGILPLIAKHIIDTHKANNRVLGRDD